MKSARQTEPMLADRLSLARRLMDLCECAVTISEKPDRYFAIEKGIGNNKNIATVYKIEDQIGIRLESAELRARLAAAGFEPISPSNRPEDRHKFHLKGVR